MGFFLNIVHPINFLDAANRGCMTSATKFPYEPPIIKFQYYIWLFGLVYTYQKSEESFKSVYNTFPFQLMQVQASKGTQTIQEIYILGSFISLDSVFFVLVRSEIRRHVHDMV